MFHKINKKEEESKKESIILQYDDEEGRRGNDCGCIIRIENIEEILGMLEENISSLLSEGKEISMVDFSDSDINDEEALSVLRVLKKNNIKLLNVINTHTLFPEEMINVSEFKEEEYLAWSFQKKYEMRDNYQNKLK